MDRMMAGMAVKPSGDIDADFAAMMIPHHQGAIDMAVAELRHGHNQQLRRIAQEIIVDQQQEIAAMRLALGQKLPPSTPAPTMAGMQCIRSSDDEISCSAAPLLDRSLSGHAPAFAGQAPGPASAAPDIPVSHHDRVYAAEQFSNTVSVIDPASNKLLGVIRLGDPQPGNFSPLYRGQVLVHGMGFSPDHKTPTVASIGFNSVTFIDTATNAVKHTAYVGRSPHEAFFTQDGSEVWVTVRGENYVDVLDSQTYQEKTRIITQPGPGMTDRLRRTARNGFVCSSFNPELAVVDV